MGWGAVRLPEKKLKFINVGVNVPGFDSARDKLNRPVFVFDGIGWDKDPARHADVVSGKLGDGDFVGLLGLGGGVGDNVHNLLGSQPSLCVCI